MLIFLRFKSQKMKNFGLKLGTAGDLKCFWLPLMTLGRGGGSKACDMECCTFFKVALQRIEDQTDNSIH